jgi:hypothetical protein
VNAWSRKPAGIRNRIALGELPNKEAERLYIGPGDGATCDGCGESIGENSLEYQFDVRLEKWSRRLRFHHECFQLWEKEAGQASER